MLTTPMFSKATPDRSLANVNATYSPNDVIIEPTDTTPFVRYNPKNRSLTIAGSSFLEDAEHFYGSFLSKIYDDLFEKNHASLELYFNSFGPKTAKMLFELFGNLRTFSQAGKNINIIWKSPQEDENMADLGASFAELFDLDIKIVHAKV